MANPDRVEDVDEVEKKAHVRALGVMFEGIDEAESREFIEELWHDPDRRHDYYQRCYANMEASDISREIKPGFEAEIRDALADNAGMRFANQDEFAHVTWPRVKALLEDAGVSEEYAQAAARSRIRAFVDCFFDYLYEEDD